MISKKQIILILCVILIFVSIYLSYKSHISQCIQTNQNIYLTLFGTDWVDYSQHSDTIIFFCYNPKNKFLDIISIPRDTIIEKENTHLIRINEFYAYSYRICKDHNQASKQILLIIENIFKNKISIPYYIQIDYDTFRKIIDIVGGIKIKIDQPMHYDDNAGRLHIHFEPGIYMLDGKKALEYVRYRDKTGDIGRIYRQQKFIKSFFKEIVNPYYFIRIPFIFIKTLRNIHTNLKLWDILNLLIEFKNLDYVNLTNIRITHLPGKPFRDLWLIDNNEIDKIIELLENKNSKSNEKVIVEILNASDFKGEAYELTKELRKEGFDVISYGNYPVKQKESIIIDRVGDLQSAKKISKISNIQEVITRYQTGLSHITVIIGQDYKKQGE